MLNITHQSLGFERTVCACAKCTAACETMPGALGPGDLEQIADYCGCNVDDPDFIRMWRASEGAIAHNRETNTFFQIPTIVPAQDHKTGHCVWLEQGVCTIHPVAPFCCRNFRMCAGDPAEDTFKSVSMHAAIMADQEYQEFHDNLSANGLTAEPIEKRRAMLEERCAELDKESSDEGV